VVREAETPVEGVKSLYIKEMGAIVEDGEVINFRINAKISFVLEGS
jgi:flavin-binding protein dodecin